jgi:hypothetical protein
LNTGPLTGAAAAFFAVSEALPLLLPALAVALFSALPLLGTFVPELAVALFAVVAVVAAVVSPLALVLAAAVAFSAPLSAFAFLSVVAQPFRRNPKSRTNSVECLGERVMFKI